MEQIQREIQSLTDKLNAMKVGKRRRNRRNPGTQVAAQSGVVTATVESTETGRKKRRRRNRGRVSGNVGTILLTRREMIKSIDIAAAGKSANGMIKIMPESFAFLKKFSMFDKVKWHKLHVYYKSAVGSTFGGSIAYGVQWSMDDIPSIDRGKIAALTPNVSHTLWMDTSAAKDNLKCPVSKLQTKPWFAPGASDNIEKGPGQVVFYVSTSQQPNAVTVGELWADYSVTLTATDF